MPKDFFPQRPAANPTIYAYELIEVETHKGLLKIGYTDRDAQTRVTEQLQTSGVQYRIVLEESAMRTDGSSFTDHDIHRHLRKRGLVNPEGEWFRCTAKEVKSAIIAIRNRTENEENRSQNFQMRPEQEAAVEKTVKYFNSFNTENSGKPPHFLWNAKMRFGKTFAAYQLAKKSGWKKILVLTFKPAVQSAWEEDLRSHIDFEGWQFISRDNISEIEIETNIKKRPACLFWFVSGLFGQNAARCNQTQKRMGSCNTLGLYYF
jgi:hypothetical protein